MNKRLRSAIAFAFVALFFVTVPIVLLWTAGYSFNWKRQRVQKTGSIQVESVPKGARVSINGTFQIRTTPTAVTRLLPEDYVVSVQHEGYIPWRKKLEVKSSKTTFATGIVLYKDTLPRIVTEKEITASAWSSDGTQVAFVDEDGESKEVSAMSAGKPPLLMARFPKDSISNEEISWSPDAKYVLLVAKSEGETHVLRLSADGSFPPLSVSERFPKGELRAHWTADGGIAVLNAAGAYVVNATTGKSSPVLLAKNVLDLDSRGSIAYVLRHTSVDSGTQRTLLEKVTASKAATMLSLPVSQYFFMQGDSGHLLVSDEKRGQVIVVDTSSAASDTMVATGTQWEPKGERLLLWNAYEISLYDPRDGSRELVTRIGSEILESAWSPAGDGVIYSTPSGISFVELDSRDVRNDFVLVRYSRVGSFSVDRANKLLRFVGGIGSQHGVFERDL